jgi:hypothetical protein
MGTELVFVLIYPVAAACLAAAVFFWFKIASSVGEPIRAYLPLAIGYGISIFGLAVLSYVDGDATFTDLIQQGYYTEAERSLYLPRRVVGSAILTLVFVLPAISFIVVPLTARLIRKDRITLKWIALYALVGWLILSLLGLLLSARTMVDPFALTYVMGYTATPVIIYGLPIPLMALLFRRRQ